MRHLDVFVFCYMLFFFSSRRRHTRYSGDWSSDVCSSDLEIVKPFEKQFSCIKVSVISAVRSEERRVGKSVDLGGRRIIKKKKKTKSRGVALDGSSLVDEKSGVGSVN